MSSKLKDPWSAKQKEKKTPSRTCPNIRAHNSRRPQGHKGKCETEAGDETDGRDGRHCTECSAVQYTVCTTSQSKYYHYPYATVEETEAERGECNQFVSARTEI